MRSSRERLQPPCGRRARPRRIATIGAQVDHGWSELVTTARTIPRVTHQTDGDGLGAGDRHWLWEIDKFLVVGTAIDEHHRGEDRRPLKHGHGVVPDVGRVINSGSPVDLEQSCTVHVRAAVIIMRRYEDQISDNVDRQEPLTGKAVTLHLGCLKR